MEFVVTLLANPNIQALSRDFVDTMAAGLAMQDIPAKKIEWLSENIACDLYISYSDADALDSKIQDLMLGQPYDAVVQPVAGRRKKLLIADMDSTMITVECIDELADFVGKKKYVAAITERAMNGEIGFEQALTERVALLKGLPETTLQQCYDERVKLMPGAKALLAGIRKAGAYSVLVSGGFTFFTSRVREALGFDEDFSNQLEVANGVLTGRVIPPILGKEAKLKTLLATCEKLKIGTEEVLAIGDGANDLPMLIAAGLGIAYHAKPVVRAQAKSQINRCDLSALLFTQGII